MFWICTSWGIACNGVFNPFGTFLLLSIEQILLSKADFYAFLTRIRKTWGSFQGRKKPSGDFPKVLGEFGRIWKLRFMENQCIRFVLVRFIRIFSCIRCHCRRSQHECDSALKRSILSGWDRRSNGYVSNSLLLRFKIWARLSSSYLLDQSSTISSHSTALESFQFLKIHENSRPGGAGLKCFQLEDHSGSKSPLPAIAIVITPHLLSLPQQCCN